MIPQMKERGYHADFCAALQGAAGTLGMTAPLSITVLLYSAAASTSVSRLAAATILPSLLLATSFMALVVWHARRHDYPRELVPGGQIVPRTLRAMPGLFALVLVVAESSAGSLLRRKSEPSCWPMCCCCPYFSTEPASPASSMVLALRLDILPA